MVIICYSISPDFDSSSIVKQLKVPGQGDYFFVKYLSIILAEYCGCRYNGFRMLHLKLGKSAGRDYLSIVRGYWDPAAKRSRTKTIQSLGYLDILREQYTDPVGHFQGVVGDMNAEREKAQAQFSLQVDPSALLSDSTGHRKNLGYAALSLIYHELGLHRFFSNRSRSWQCSYSVNEIMKLLVFSRILSPASKRSTCRQKGKYFEKMDFSLADIYRCLSRVNTLRDAIQLHLHNKMVEQYGRSAELVYYDLTNYYFEIDEQDELRKKGVSKEHRPDPIIQMGLFTDSDGIPIAYRLFPGNTNDSETLIPLMAEIKKKYGVKRTIVVADKGLNTGDNIAFNILAKNGYVFSQSVRGGNKELKEYVLNDTGYRTLSDGFRLKSRVYPREIWVTTKEGKKTRVPIEEKQVTIYSAKYAAKAKRDRQAVVQKAHQLVANPSSYTKATSYGAAKYVKRLVFDQKTGEIIDSKQRPVFDEEKLKEEERFDGYYVIATSECKKSDEEILEIYRGLWQIEEAFRVSKGDLEARPVYLSREDRIQAHFLVCFIALYIARLLAMRLDKKYSVGRISSSLNAMSVSFVGENLYVGDYADEITSDLKEKLQIDLDRKFVTLGEIRKIIGATKQGFHPQGP